MSEYIGYEVYPVRPVKGHDDVLEICKPKDPALKYWTVYGRKKYKEVRVIEAIKDFDSREAAIGYMNTLLNN